MDITYPLVPIANFLGFILALVPLATNVFNAANSTICIYAVWISVLCFCCGVNTVLWRDNVVNRAPVWCDITSHITVCSITALTGCSLALSRRLYKLTSHRSSRFVQYPHTDIVIDCILCCGIPIASAGLYYIIQGVRYEIMEQTGCTAAIYPSGVAILIIFAPPLLLSVACMVYYIPALAWTFFSRRREIDAFLAGNRLMNRNHYFRIMTMEIVIFFNMVAAIVIVAFDVRLFAQIPGGLQFWPGWTAIHSDWQPVQIPASEWGQSSWNHFATRWNEWINPIFAFIFFVVYGLSNQARAKYHRAFSSFSRLSLPHRTSQPIVKEDSQRQVILLAPGGSSLSSITTKPSTNFQESVTIKVEKQVETHYEPALFEIEGSRDAYNFGRVEIV